ncbi:hypothetical protein [Maridesulfovibrio ferrireducens]|uniref:hypothetical protein n=1 Tax=Maridesulfovibrio ferrireducens TaxID=246191 RepID=UPI001A2D7A79|nr:hypothetical protein [Maridesulfovibrio ferrireducens]MBI9113178.1 hypothetical protein [Maridesulfovibrio ferrireducens]
MSKENDLALLRGIYNTTPVMAVRSYVEHLILDKREQLETEENQQEMYRLQGQIKALKDILEDIKPVGDNAVQLSGAYT